MAIDLTSIIGANVGQFVNDIIARFKADPTIALEKSSELQLMQMQLQGKLIDQITAQVQGQLEINKQEATSTSWFVSGWRPFVGWILGAALAYDLVLQPFVMFLLAAFHWHAGTTPLPTLDSTQVSELLIPLLGLGTMRTVEKIQGAASNH
jgi:hypothetical protein